MRSLILDRSTGFVPARSLDDHHGITYHAEDLVVDGELRQACIKSDATLDCKRDLLSADLFSVTSLMKAGSTDLLREVPALSGSSMEIIDHLNRGLKSFSEINAKIMELSKSE